MKKLLKRLPVLIIGIPATYYLLVKSELYVLTIFLCIVSLIGQYELFKLLNKNSEKSYPIFEWFAGLFILISSYFYNINGLICSYIISSTIAMLLTVFRGLKGNGINFFAYKLFNLFYLPFCLACFELISKSKGGQTIFILLASIWALDIGAYIFGSIIRGPKLAPNISPNKTISGAIGGAICSISFIFIMKQYGYFTLDITETKIWFLALSIATIGQIADLFESVLKREADVKDSSSLLGAHGGILDRIDSVLFLGPISYIIMLL